MNWFKKYFPSILSVAGVVVTMFSGQIQSAISAHPTVDAIGAALLGIVAHLWPSPVAPSSASAQK